MKIQPHMASNSWVIRIYVGMYKIYRPVFMDKNNDQTVSAVSDVATFTNCSL